VTIFLLLLHGLSAVLLLGAITHQALALWAPTTSHGGWWDHLRAVHPERYTRMIIVLFSVTALLGAISYPPFRAVARAEYLDAHAPWTVGLFEIKEHAAAIGLALLPAYWAVWRNAAEPRGRRAVTSLLTLITWWNFLVGHVVNNVRGL